MFERLVYLKCRSHGALLNCPLSPLPQRQVLPPQHSLSLQDPACLQHLPQQTPLPHTPYTGACLHFPTFALAFFVSLAQNTFLLSPCLLYLSSLSSDQHLWEAGPASQGWPRAFHFMLLFWGLAAVPALTRMNVLSCVVLHCVCLQNYAPSPSR